LAILSDPIYHMIILIIIISGNINNNINIIYLIPISYHSSTLEKKKC